MKFDLNSEQKKAIETTEGRVLILAGAGSGKTRVLTLRIAYLIKNLKVSPESILGLTFTNKAAAEMRNRVAQMVDRNIANQICLCTFHSFCMQILRHDIDKLGYTKQFSLYDEKDMTRLANLISRDILGSEGNLPSISQALIRISLAKNRGIDPEELDGETWFDEFTKKLYKRLLASMRAYNAVDFDSLLTLTVKLFEDFPEVLEKYQKKYRFVMIDEYQDTNPIQYKLASLLTTKSNNLCVVGDDDQSIYGWRGAEVKNILEFEQATVIKLEQNYRSTNTILKAANAVIHHNDSRHLKALWSSRGDGEPIEVFYAPNDLNEAQAVAYRIVKMKERYQLKWSDFAILYRSNALSRQFELELMKHPWSDYGRPVRGIPYQIYGGLEFYERREIKDLFAYLRLIINPKDQEALLRIINQPRRGIGEKALDVITQHNRKRNIPLWNVLNDLPMDSSITPRAIQGIHSFISTIDKAKKDFNSLPLHQAMNNLIAGINYKKAIEEEVKSQQMRTFKWENVQEFISSIIDYEENTKNPSLHDFITTIPLKSEWEEKQKQTKENLNTVKLLTFHSAKGLEFPVCFLIGVEDNIIPHEKSMMETGIEEERRLFYVAMTRAMDFLTISMAQKRKRMGQENKCRPSRFLFEIPKNLINVTKWDG